MSTYLETPQDLDRLLEGAPSSAVILNEALEGGDALPLSQVLTTLLSGPDPVVHGPSQILRTPRR